MASWPFDPPRTPMEAKVATRFPRPPGWAYEPKWDGFRALAWSRQRGQSEAEPRLDSRNERPLLRYFPELRGALEALPGGTVVDGEIVVVREDVTDFDALQQRIHPAASRIERLSGETPAQLVAFDLLAHEGDDLRGQPFELRRARLEALLATLEAPWSLTPSTRDLDEAERWHRAFESAGCDGIVAKRVDQPYVEGKREMVKIKHRRTVDVVIGGYRVHKEGDRIGSLLLGLYNEAGELHFIGHTSGFSDEQRVELLAQFSRLRKEESFGEEARRPGAESRWTAARRGGGGGGDAEGGGGAWVAVQPSVVAEVSYDQITGWRFRHATRLERWRPDKDPRACTLDQLERPEGVGFAEVVSTGP